MTEARKSLRIKDRTKVFWTHDGENSKVKGIVRDISATGMKLESQSDQDIDEGTILTFNSLQTKSDYLPHNGRVVWKKTNRFSQNNHIFGVEFVEPSEESLSKLRLQVQKGISRITRKRRMQIMLDIGLFVLLLGLIGYIAWTSLFIYKDIRLSYDNLYKSSNQQSMITQSYINLYQETQMKLSGMEGELLSSKEMLADVSKELLASQYILEETESMLSRVRADNIQMRSELNKIQTEREQLVQSSLGLQADVNALQEKKMRTEKELALIESKMNFLAGNISNKKEGKELLALYRQRMRLVKVKIRGYRKEAGQVRAAALKEQDRIRLILGNNGYFIKDGKPVTVDEEKYRMATLGDQKMNPDVAIDVTFIE